MIRKRIKYLVWGLKGGWKRFPMKAQIDTTYDVLIDEVITEVKPLIDYKVTMHFQARDLEDAENFVHSMTGSDWIEHLETESGLDIEETR